MLYTESESSGSVGGDQQRKRKRTTTRNCNVELHVNGSVVSRIIVNILLPEKEKTDEIRTGIKLVLFEDGANSSPEVILHSVRITSTDGHVSIPTDDLRKDCGDDDAFVQALSSLLAKKVTSDTHVCFFTPAGQLKAAREAVTHKEKKAITDHNLSDLDKEFIHEWVANLGEKFLPFDPASSRVIGSMLGACVMHILGDNSQCEPIVKEALHIQRHAMMACPNKWKYKSDDEMKTSLHSVTGDLSSSATVLLAICQLSAAIAQWNAKDYMNDFSECARKNIEKDERYDDKFWRRHPISDVLKKAVQNGGNHV